MRVLVLTNQFAEFAGSEIVALEVAHWFLQRGDQVAIAANLIRPPISMSDHAQRIELLRDIESIDLTSFDLVWCQHSLLSLLSATAFEAAAASPPLVALVSLSPFEPYEHLDGLLANALSAKVFANSPETAEELVRRNHNLIQQDRVTVFHNAAPATFWQRPVPRIRALNSLTMVSNHAPSELMAAKRGLEERGIRVRHMGLQSNYQLVGVSDIDDCDALITIGKTVIYGVARSRPTYMYDRFGGEGWLTRANFEHNLAYNFSGRPAMRRLSEHAIMSEIIEGFHNAASEMERLGEECDLTRFHLDQHLAPLREQALKPKGWRAFRLQRALASPKFRAHLELARHNHLVMRRSYLLANDPI